MNQREDGVIVVGGSPVATLDDLYKVEGKAELIKGKIIRMPLGFLPGIVAGEIFAQLHEFVHQTEAGFAYTASIGFAQRLPLPSGRESFSPDAAFYTGTLPKNLMRFIDGAPDFAAEVRSENDYGPVAESNLAAKRADYFLAGTTVVWDVDPVAQTISVYRATAPSEPATFRRGDTADAEPAVPGWRVNVDSVFPR